MSALSALSAVNSGATRTSAAGNLGVEDLLKVLLTQLTYQDPLKPMDNLVFMAQIAQFTTLEQTQQLNQRIDALIASQSSLQSVGLLGRTVTFTDTSSVQRAGLVQEISYESDSPSLKIRISTGEIFSSIPITSVQLVR